MPASKVELAVADLTARGDAVVMGRDWLIHRGTLALLTDRADRALAETRNGMQRADLRAVLDTELDQRSLAVLLRHWQDRGLVTVQRGGIRLATGEAPLLPRQQALLDRVAVVYRDAGFAPPTAAAAARALGVPSAAVVAMLDLGSSRGVLVATDDGLVFHAGTYSRAVEIVREIAARDGSVSVGAFRDAIASGRRTAVALLERLDSDGVTLREGDVRVLVGHASTG